MIKSKSSRIGDYIIAFICLLLMLACLLPMLNILARSLSSAQSIIRNEVFLWPKGWNTQAYHFVLSDSKYMVAHMDSDTDGHLHHSVHDDDHHVRFPLTYDKLKGRRFFNTLII